MGTTLTRRSFVSGSAGALMLGKDAVVTAAETDNLRCWTGFAPLMRAIDDVAFSGQIGGSGLALLLLHG